MAGQRQTGASEMEPQLLKAVAEGDQQAFRRLFDLHRDKVYSFALYLTRSETLSEEITQDTFLQVWLHRAELTGLDYFNSWLKAIARNLTFTCLRRLAREKLFFSSLEDQQPVSVAESPSPEAELIGKEFNLLLLEAIGRLPVQQQKVYLLSRRDGLRNAQIEKKMHLSPFTVKNHMKEALRSIRLYMDARIHSWILIALALFFRD